LELLEPALRPLQRLAQRVGFARAPDERLFEDRRLLGLLFTRRLELHRRGEHRRGELARELHHEVGLERRQLVRAERPDAIDAALARERSVDHHRVRALRREIRERDAAERRLAEHAHGAARVGERVPERVVATVVRERPRDDHAFVAHRARELAEPKRELVEHGDLGDDREIEGAGRQIDGAGSEGRDPHDAPAATTTPAGGVEHADRLGGRRELIGRAARRVADPQHPAAGGEGREPDGE